MIPKFRVWDGTKMHYGVSIDGQGRPISPLWNTKAHIVMQSSGQPDRNGKEIYAGDFLNDQPHIHKVMCGTAQIEDNEGYEDNLVCGFYLESSKRGLNHFDCTDSMEIIGNTYEGKSNKI